MIRAHGAYFCLAYVGMGYYREIGSYSLCYSKAGGGYTYNSTIPFSIRPVVVLSPNVQLYKEI